MLLSAAAVVRVCVCVQCHEQCVDTVKCGCKQLDQAFTTTTTTAAAAAGRCVSMICARGECVLQVMMAEIHPPITLQIH